MSNPLHEGLIASESDDKIILWPIILTVVVSLAWAIAVGFFPLVLFALVIFGLSSGIPLAAALAVVAVFPAIAVVRSALRGRWRRAISYAVPAVVAVVVALDVDGFAKLSREAGDRAHFYLMRPQYVAEVAAKPSDGQPRLRVWNWGGMVWSSKGVVYDESDEIMRPVADQTADWKSRARNSELACDGYGVESLGNHFYLAYFPC
jgi:hypothetical protein